MPTDPTDSSVFGRDTAATAAASPERSVTCSSLTPSNMRHASGSGHPLCLTYKHCMRLNALFGSCTGLSPAEFIHSRQREAS